MFPDGPTGNPHDYHAGSDMFSRLDASMLAAVLRHHSPGPGSTVPGSTAPAWLSAACVHGNGYGTRSAMIVTVGATGPPQVQVADGPSCQAPLVDAGALWEG